MVSAAHRFDRSHARAVARAWCILLVAVASLTWAGSATAASPVSGVWVVAGDSRNTITWERGDSSNTHYRIYRSTSDGPLGTLLATVPVPGTSYVDGSAVNGTSYYYTVRGWDGTTESASPAAKVVRTGAQFTVGRW